MPGYEEEARKAAEEFRDENGLGIAPIADIVALIEQTQDVDVAVLGVDDSNEHGLTMVDPARGATVVAVARSNRPMRWRSTLAHELGHLIFRDHGNGKSGALSAGSVVERRAQSFARHVLIPLPGVRHFLERRNEPLEMKAFSDLVQRFQVSPAVAAIQLRDLGCCRYAAIHSNGPVSTHRRWRPASAGPISTRASKHNHASAEPHNDC